MFTGAQGKAGRDVGDVVWIEVEGDVDVDAVLGSGSGAQTRVAAFVAAAVGEHEVSVGAFAVLNDEGAGGCEGFDVEARHRITHVNPLV